MPISYQPKDEAEFVWKESRERITLVVRQLANRVADAVLAEVNQEFVRALHDGEVLTFDPSREEILRRLTAATQRALDAG